MGKTRVGPVGEARRPQPRQAGHATPDPLARAVVRLTRAAEQLERVAERQEGLVTDLEWLRADFHRLLERFGGAPSVAPPPPAETP